MADGWDVVRILADTAQEHPKVVRAPGWVTCGRCGADMTDRGYAEHVAAAQEATLTELGILNTTGEPR